MREWRRRVEFGNLLYLSAQLVSPLFLGQTVFDVRDLALVPRCSDFGLVGLVKFLRP